MTLSLILLANSIYTLTVYIVKTDRKTFGFDTSANRLLNREMELPLISLGDLDSVLSHHEHSAPEDS